MSRERGVPAAVKHRLLRVVRSRPQLACASGVEDAQPCALSRASSSLGTLTDAARHTSAASIPKYW